MEEKVNIESNTIDIQLEVVQNDKLKVFTISGELDVHQATRLKSEIIEQIEMDGWKYKFDLKNLGYLDSTGLGILVSLKKQIERNQERMFIVNVKEPVLNVFKITKLDEYFQLEKSE